MTYLAVLAASPCDYDDVTFFTFFFLFFGTLVKDLRSFRRFRVGLLGPGTPRTLEPWCKLSRPVTRKSSMNGRRLSDAAGPFIKCQRSQLNTLNINIILVLPTVMRNNISNFKIRNPNILSLS